MIKSRSESNIRHMQVNQTISRLYQSAPSSPSQTRMRAAPNVTRQDGQLGQIFASAQRSNRSSDTAPVSPLSRSDSNESLSSNGSRASTASDISFFGDRAGIESIPNGLATTSAGGPNGLARGAFPFLLKTAVEYKFNLVLTLRNNDIDNHWARSELAKAGLSLEHEEGRSATYGREGSDAKVVINRSSLDRVVNWSEDVQFFGRSSMHTRDRALQASLPPPPRYAVVQSTSTSVSPEELTGLSRDALERAGQDRVVTVDGSSLNYRRESDWTELGLRNPVQHSLAMYAGNSTIDFPAIPEAVSAPTGQQGTRAFPKKESIFAAIDGGNFLSNGAVRGDRLYLVGLDSVAITFDYISQQSDAGHVTPKDAMDLIKAELHPIQNDRVVFVEQPTYHIDMSMTVSGENEVVLSDTRALHQMLNPDEEMSEFASNKALLEDCVEAQLTQAGVDVERKPWAGEAVTSFNLFNGEFVRSEETEQSYFITNGIFGVEEPMAEVIKEDIREFYDAVGITVLFSDSDLAKTLLEKGYGGIGCKTNGVNC